MKRVVGITGGIGAGKSIVSRILRCRGFEVYDCDSNGRILTDQSESLKSEIAAKMGPGCILPGGSLDRGEVAKIVFADRQLLKWLNSRVHAMVTADIKQKIAISQGEAFFIESAILCSSGLDTICDEIWLVRAPHDLRLQRACARENADPEAIMARIKAQEEEENLLSRNRCVHTILNDQSHSLLLQLSQLTTNH